MNAKTNYFMFPIAFINESINDIINWCIMENAKKTDYDEANFPRQILYKFYRCQNEIPLNILIRLNEMVDKGRLIIDEDYNGFNREEFNPEIETENLQNEFKTDQEFMNDCFEFYKYNQAKNYLSISGGDYETCIKTHEKMKNIFTSTVEKFGKMPHVQLNTSWLFDARDGKIEDQLFRFIVAVKSLIGKKKYVHTNKKNIIFRMYGLKNDEMFAKAPDSIKEKVKSLLNRYQFEKLRNVAVNRGFIQYLSYNGCRGFYVSTRFKDVEELANQIIDRRKNKQAMDQKYLLAKSVLKAAFKPIKSIEFEN